MIFLKNIFVLGGDERNLSLCRFLRNNGYSVSWLYAEKCKNADDFIKTEYIDNPYAVILPLPLSRDKVTLNTPLSSCVVRLSELDFSGAKYVFTSADTISGINYFSSESVLIKNARLTAVGFLKELFSYEKSDILKKKALVTGFGRVSQAVCDILYRNGVCVTVAARDKIQRHTAETRGYNALAISEAEKNLCKYDYVINTVPERLFSYENIIKSEENTAFFELAQKLTDKTKRTPKAYIECKGMPGKHLPEAAGEVIAHFVCEKMRE